MNSSIFLSSTTTPRKNPSNSRGSFLIVVLVWINWFECSEQIILLLWIHWQTSGNLSIHRFVDDAGSGPIGFTSGNIDLLDFGLVVATILTRIPALICTSVAIAFQTHFVETAHQRLFLVHHFITWDFLQNLRNKNSGSTLNTNEPCDLHIPNHHYRLNRLVDTSGDWSSSRVQQIHFPRLRRCSYDSRTFWRRTFHSPVSANVDMWLKPRRRPIYFSSGPTSAVANYYWIWLWSGSRKLLETNTRCSLTSTYFVHFVATIICDWHMHFRGGAIQLLTQRFVLFLFVVQLHLEIFRLQVVASYQHFDFLILLGQP